MSAYDRPPSYYQHNDITDPTPYEDDGEEVVLMNHDALVETIAVHRECLMDSAEGVGGFERFLQVVEDLGFEIEEGGAP